MNIVILVDTMKRIANILSSLFDGEITVDYTKYKYLKSLVSTSIITTLSFNNTQEAAFDGINIKPLNEIAASNIIKFVVTATLHYEHYNALLDSAIETHDLIVCILLADKLCVHHHVIRHIIGLLVARLIPIDDSYFECPACLAQRNGNDQDQEICFSCGTRTCYVLTELITERTPEKNQLLIPDEYETLHNVVEKYYDDDVLLLLCKGLCKVKKPSSFKRIMMKSHVED